MTDATQEQRDAYLALLSVNLAKIGEPGFRKLCDALGWPYDEIEGETIAKKSRRWIDILEGSNSIPELVTNGEKLFPGYTWGTCTQVKGTAPRRYYIASSRKEKAIVEKLVITNDQRFERIHEPGKADYLVFDLDKPPEDWIKYVGAQEHIYGCKPHYGTTIFAQFDQCEKRCDIQLNGMDIMYMLTKLYDRRYEFILAKSVEDIWKKLWTLEENRGTREQIDKLSNRQAMASVR